MIDLNKNKNNDNSKFNPTPNTDVGFFSIDAYSKEATTAKVFSKEGLFSFAGRRARAQYFWICFATNLISNILDKIFKGSDIFMFVVFMFFFYIQCTNLAKRMHDIEMPGKYALIPFVAMFIAALTNSSGLLGICAIGNFIFSMYILFKKGTTGDNKYGPDPLK